MASRANDDRGDAPALRRSDPGGEAVDIYLVAGEASGDLHAGNLVRALRSLRPGLRVRGLGGPRLQEAGCEIAVDLTAFSVMGIRRVLPLLGRFIDVVHLFRREVLMRQMTLSSPAN